MSAATHADRSRTPLDLAAYRLAVADVMLDVAGQAGPRDVARAEAILLERTAEPEIATMLAATGQGADAAVARLLAEVRRFRPNPRGARDLGALVRVLLLAEIENVWWGHLPAYRTDAQVRAAAELVDVAALRRQGRLRFCYRRQASNPLTRAARAGHRWLWPGQTPHTAGLRTPRARPEVVTLLHQLAHQLARRAPAPVPALWVTSLTRSEQQQRRLQALGYTAPLPSSHCVGYAANVDLDWLRRFDLHGSIAALLLDWQRSGELNVIDEGRAWHVCVSPSAAQSLRRNYAREMSS